MFSNTRSRRQIFSHIRMCLCVQRNQKFKPDCPLDNLPAPDCSNAPFECPFVQITKKFLVSIAPFRCQIAANKPQGVVGGCLFGSKNAYHSLRFIMPINQIFQQLKAIKNPTNKNPALHQITVVR